MDILNTLPNIKFVRDNYEEILIKLYEIEPTLFNAWKIARGCLEFDLERVAEALQDGNCTDKMLQDIDKSLINMEQLAKQIIKKVEGK